MKEEATVGASLDAARAPASGDVAAGEGVVQHRISIGEWDVLAATAPMAGSVELDTLGDALGGLKPPSMVFTRSHLTLRRGPFELAFRASDALAGVGAHDPSVQVRAARKWAEHAARAPVELSAGPPSSSRDWTYTTRYAGSLKGAAEAPGAEVIDMRALRDASRPIRFFATVPLFDDELDDNGAASYRIRIVRVTRSIDRRTAPSCPVANVQPLTVCWPAAMHAGLSLCAGSFLSACRWRATPRSRCTLLPQLRLARTCQRDHATRMQIRQSSCHAAPEFAYGPRRCSGESARTGAQHSQYCFAGKVGKITYLHTYSLSCSCCRLSAENSRGSAIQPSCLTISSFLNRDCLIGYLTYSTLDWIQKCILEKS